VANRGRARSTSRKAAKSPAERGVSTDRAAAAAHSDTESETFVLLKNKPTAASSTVAKPEGGRGVFYVLLLQPLSRLAPNGWLNLAADAMHNFTDGVAIGAAYSAMLHGQKAPAGGGGGCSHGTHAPLASLGAATALSVLFHEVPHEIGDFTVLVRSGLTKNEAIRAQFGTALAAFAGTSFGLSFGSLSRWSNLVLVSGTAGGFLYIATIGMLADTAGAGGGAKQALFDGIGFILGVSVMVVVAVMEH